MGLTHHSIFASAGLVQQGGIRFLEARIAQATVYLVMGAAVVQLYS